MASLRETVQRVLQEARDGIGWIAFYKEGRGWGAECFWPEYHEKSNDFCHDDDDLAELRDILKADRNAIFVNGYYTNLGSTLEMTRESLANALRWQYENQFNLLREAI